MTRRTAAENDRRLRQLGTDLALFYPGPAGYWEDADLRAAIPRDVRGPVDIDVVSGVEAADQLFVNRLKTRKGELAPLGHPEYGSRHHELIGQPNVERTRALIKLYVLEAMSHEPRVAKIHKCDVTADHQPPRDVVRIVMQVEIVGEPNPRNLVVPFSLAVGAESDVAGASAAPAAAVQTTGAQS
jgi:phage baseplate assembly protein W